MFKRCLNILTLVLPAFFLFFFLSGGRFPAGFSLAHAGFFDFDLEIFEETLDLVEEKYVYPPDFKNLFSAAIEQMVKSADPENLSADAAAGSVLYKNQSRLKFRLDYNRDNDTEAFKKVYYFLLDQYKGRVSKKDLEMAAIDGFVNALDPYSQYMDKETFDKSMKDTEGKYGGVGMVISMRDYKLVVVKTMKNSPAERAGILPDDVFAKVDGRETKGLQIQDLADLLRGEPNTKVSVSLLRPSDAIERNFTLTREIISVETVVYKPLRNNAAYIKISSFSKQTEDQLKEALAKAQSDKARSIILDLRDNPGGLLDQSVKVAGYFLPRDHLVVYTQGRLKDDRSEFRSKSKNGRFNLPVVALINHYSASASEIVVGSLKDWDKALVIGENSYGKGSVQTIFRISDGSGLRLTTSKYFTPSGIDITKHGIAPDIAVIRDLPEDKKTASPPPPIEPKSPIPQRSQIQLKESELDRYLKEKGRIGEEEKDPLVNLALLVLKDNSAVPNKKRSMEKARELAANIRY